jgi:hypothetical protein
MGLDSFVGAGAAILRISAVNISDTGLVNAEAASFIQELRKFHAIEHLDLSLNRGLDSETATFTLQSIAGKWYMVMR